ncbi:MAG: type III-A CRISPR-associated RAMP protein Csm5, partial [Deltaproteobacteria bacterium RBG_16_47_11]
MEFKLNILSPVHIGCGESYNAVSYLLDKRHKPERLSVFDERAIFDVLDDKQKIQFVKWIETDERPNLFNFIRNVLRDENFKLSNQIQKKAHYVIPNLAEDERLNDINVFIKEMKSPFIPGTEVKGAIRTALLHCALQDNRELQAWLEKELQTFRERHSQALKLVGNERNLGKPNPNNPRQKLSKLKDSLVKEIGQISGSIEEKVLRCRPDAKYDVMKFLQ